MTAWVHPPQEHKTRREEMGWGPKNMPPYPWATQFSILGCSRDPVETQAGRSPAPPQPWPLTPALARGVQVLVPQSHLDQASSAAYPTGANRQALSWGGKKPACSRFHLSYAMLLEVHDCHASSPILSPFEHLFQHDDISEKVAPPVFCFSCLPMHHRGGVDSGGRGSMPDPLVRAFVPQPSCRMLMKWRGKGHRPDPP